MKKYAISVIVGLWCLSGGVVGGEPSVLQIGDQERGVLIVGTPFNHSYNAPRMETLLLQQFACCGLIFRQVTLVNSTLEGLLYEHFDDQVMIHKPSLVIIQAGLDDLLLQYRSQVYDFSVYPKNLEAMVKKLQEANVKVVVCSVTPCQNGSTKNKLIPPMDGLKTWVDAARDIASRHKVFFVDLFTEAIEWPMISGGYFYDTQGHEKLWKLLTSQLRFEPVGSSVLIEADASQPPQCKGATVSALKTEAGSVSLILQNNAGAGPVMLKIQGLAAGKYEVMAGDKKMAEKSSEELKTGIDLGDNLQSQVNTKEYKDEIVRGHEKVGAIAAIRKFSFPDWVKVADFEGKKQAAIKVVLDELSQHDAVMRKLVTPMPMVIRIAPANQKK